jgi:uncharacterized protein
VVPLFSDRRTGRGVRRLNSVSSVAQIHVTRCGMRYVLFYESADDMLPLAREHFPAHRARWQSYLDTGTLTGIGTFGDPQREGSMAIFSSREAAEEFASGDPFVKCGVVRRWYIRAWDDVLHG